MSHGGVMVAGRYMQSLGNTPADDYKATEFEYLTCTLPNQLEGEPLIWKVIFDAENKEVVEKAIEFLNNLYMVLNN